jgi:hypothetical protein
MQTSPRARGYAVATAVLAVAALGASATSVGAPTVAVGVQLRGNTSLEKVQSPLVLIDRGTVTGSPVGSGAIRLVYTLHPESGVATTTFTITNRKGTVAGTATSRYAVTRVHITFTGAGSMTRGTGAYRGIRAKPMAFDAIHSITGKKEAVAFTGRATLP